MAQLTQADVLAYNKKVEAAKTKAADDKARKELAEREFARLCNELSELPEMQGRVVTPENFEAERAAFMAEAEKTMAAGTSALARLTAAEAEASASENAPSVPVPISASTPAAANKTAGGIDLDDIL
ncbi:hypothetical protein FACS1894208_02360 [Clostridia bacterium]|nr:hypothetical protein FACS1894208_02360 [Clostridia bacterium]